MNNLSIAGIVSNNIKSEARRIIESNLQGIKKGSSFDIGKIDYKIDPDTLDYRIEKITLYLVELIIPEVITLMERSNYENNKYTTI